MLHKKGSCLTLLVSAVWLAATGQPANAQESTLALIDGLISVKARGQSLVAVLRDLATRTGMQIRVDQNLPDRVGVDIQPVALVEGLRLLLGSHNYLIVETRGHVPALLIVLSGPNKADAGRAPLLGQAAKLAVPLAQAANSLAPDPLLERALLDSDPVLRIDAVERLGDRGDARSLALIQHALSDSNDAVRAVATQILRVRKEAVSAERKGGNS